MKIRRAAPAFLVTMLAAMGLLSAPAGAADPAPVWKLEVIPTPTHFIPGSNVPGSYPGYAVLATNIGGAASSGPTVITTTLPSGLAPGKSLPSGAAEGGGTPSCGVSAETTPPTPRTVTCTVATSIPPGGYMLAKVPVAVEPLPDPSTVTVQGTIEGGGAPTTSAANTVTVSAAVPDFGFVPGATNPDAAFTEIDASAATQAASHPYQLTINTNFTTFKRVTVLNNASGDLRDVNFDFPPGLVVNPEATPVRCTEVQLQTATCPPAAQVGLVAPRVAPTGFGPNLRGLYNMVPPPGMAAELGFFVANLFFHVEGGVRAGDYGLASTTNDLPIALGVIGIQVQLWGDPSSPSHDEIRGELSTCEIKPCKVAPQNTPFLTMPTSCTAALPISASIDSWLKSGDFVTSVGNFTDVDNTPTGVNGCASVEFSPTLKARPTTTVADAPTGLEVDLHFPQTEELGTLSESNLKDAVVTLPEGLVINPASANGLTGCSSAQIGIDPSSGVANGKAPSCPNTSKIGSVQVDTPLLDHPLPGAVYVATPHDNPFDSLLAIYIAIDDPISGTLIKLAGHVVADPNTGRLTTIFANNPQLPFSDFKLDFFGGAAAALRTPATCGTYSTTSQMTPWSENTPATPSDTYTISQSPVGGACASVPGEQPNSPSFDAGTVSPLAGAYSPFVLHLRRDDGSQQFSAISVKTPPGLLGKLAGTSYCPEANLAAAEGKSGNEERANPSCPASSRVGTVDVAAGAGPAPYNTTGIAYLTGPYKGAPLGLAIVTPAAAGPYDLGTVVVRTALQLDPEGAQITAVSDPVPQILQGITLDVRSISLKLDRPDFTLNPTSCNPLAVSGQITSSLGQVVSLERRFQVAECSALAFKPKLDLRLYGPIRRGAHPRLRGELTMPPGGNIARASVALPRSEFLDNAHIGTVCTRVQYAARECPEGSVYGHAVAYTPLLDQPLEGPVYLRSSNHELPDLVAFLDGQIHVDVAGRVDSLKGAIRTTFEAVPDAPVSKFVIEMAGGKKGLLQNSTNICKSPQRAVASFDGQNGKTADFKPLVRPKCPAKYRRHKGKRRHHHRHASSRAVR